MFLGLNQLHSANIMHRDIKTENVLIFHNGQAKLADLGLAKQLHYRQKMASNTIVTLAYRAPEIILGETSYLFSVDIWSMGCVMVELLSKQLRAPFTCDDSDQSETALHAANWPNMSCAKTLALIFSLLGSPDAVPGRPLEKCAENPEFQKIWPCIPQPIQHKNLAVEFGI